MGGGGAGVVLASQAAGQTIPRNLAGLAGLGFGPAWSQRALGFLSDRDQGSAL